VPLRAPLPLSKDAPRWVYESFRRIELALKQQAFGIANIDRGEAPTGGGTPLQNSHHLLTDLTNYDDHPQYLYLPGRTGGQLVFGDKKTTVAGTDVGLTFRAFNGDPNDTTSGTAQISILDTDARISAPGDIYFTTKATDTKGLVLFTGAGGGFVNAVLDGSLTIIPAGSTEKFLLLKTSSVDTAYGDNKDDVIFQRLVSRVTGNFVVFGHVPTSISNIVTPLSSIRKSDGAFVGPIAPSIAVGHLLTTVLFDDVVAGAAARGDLITGQGATPKWQKLAIGPGTQILTSDGTDISWQPPAIPVIEHSDTTDHDAFDVSCTTNGTTTLSSAAGFGAVQVGHVIYGIGIPVNTTITDISGAPNTVIMSNSATDSTTQTRTFASDDHTQLIRKFGPVGQFVGAKPAGTVIAGGFQVGTRFGVGTVIPAAANREVLHVEPFDWTSGTALILANLRAQHSGTGSVTGTHKTLIIANTGAPLRTSGSPSFTGIDIVIANNIPAGLTDNIIIGANFSVLSNISGNTVNEVDGLNLEAGTSSAGTITLARAANFILRPGSATVGTMKGIDIQCSSTTQQTGTVTNAFGIDLDTFVSTGTISGAGAVTNWYGIRRANAIPGAVTNKWFIYLLADIPSIHAGPIRFGDSSTPTHFIEVAAGTTTKAPIILVPGVTLTAATSGAIENDGTRLYYTTNTPTRKTLAFTTDSLPATPGFSRIFATMGA
jgi:hypothetical protein